MMNDLQESEGPGSVRVKNDEGSMKPGFQESVTNPVFLRIFDSLEIRGSSKNYSRRDCFSGLKILVELVPIEASGMKSQALL